MNIKPPLSREEFELNLLTFLNQILPALDRHNRSYPSIEADTPLFESGIVDSLSILHLIGFVENQTGRTIPDEMILPPNFRSPEAIVRAFWPVNPGINEEPAPHETGGAGEIDFSNCARAADCSCRL